uniref:Protein lingerer n=1 Tax=Cacopsylla melanoneura TaxID=428564 RepID=A0A8D8WX83_9HEMI
MSTSNRTSNRGGAKSSKQQQQQQAAQQNHSGDNHKTDSSNKSATDANTNNKAHKNDTGANNSAGTKSLKNSAGGKQATAKPGIQPTAEQLRIARLTNSSKTPGLDGGEDGLEFAKKIRTVIDATKKSEEAACAALAECDGDVSRAVEVLIESDDFEFTSVKKKKNKAVPNSKTESGKDKSGSGGGGEEGELNHVTSANGGGGNFERRGGRGRGRGGSTTDRGGRPFRSRENKENEGRPGGDDFTGGDRPRRGGLGGPRMTNGPRAGPRGGRGSGRGGPGGPRTYSSRGGDGRDGFPKSIDTWNNPGSEDTTAAPTKMETWGEFPSPEDWDNEEYTGSLADSKVFTPSSATDNLPSTGVNPGSVDPTANTSHPDSHTLNTSFNSTEVADTISGTTGGVSVSGGTSDELRPPTQSPVSIPGTLTAAQSQYLSQLTQQAAAQSVPSSQPLAPSYATVSSPPTPVSYTTGTEFVNSYSTTLNDIGSTGGPGAQVMPQRSKAPRTRVPPPSKIPASAVEMPPGPGETGSSGLGTIDVQFGALDFGSEPSHGASTGGFETAGPEQNSSTGPPGVTMPKYSSQATDPMTEHTYVSSTSLAAAASQLKNNHASLTSSLSKSTGDSLLSGPDSGYHGASAGRNTTFQELASMASKAAQDSYDTSSPFPQPGSTASLYQSKTPSAASNAPYASQASYSTSNNVYNVSSSASAAAVAGYPSSMSNGSYSNNSNQYNSSSYVPSGYPGAYSTQSYQQPGTNSYGSSSTGAPTSQSYQSYSGLSGAATGAYNSYQTSGGAGSNPLAHKLSSAASGGAGSLSKDSQYETSIPQQSGTPSSLNSTPTGLSSLSQQTASQISSSNSSSVTSNQQQNQKSSSGSSTGVGGSNKSGASVASMPPGVAAPVVGTQYIMSSTGLPYMYNQPAPMYNLEDFQMLSNRIPHAYYDLGFPPTSSMGGRGEPSVAAYSTMSTDARFARTDNNASPVPSSLSTQNATQAPLLNPPLPYAYYYSSIPSNPFSYSTPPYPLVNTGGYASTQPNSGGAGAGKTSASGSQVSGATPSPQQPQGTGSSADLMYSKSQHASLAKVNSYDKATFHHTGTPPPYSLPGVGVGSGVGGMGPSGAFAAAQHSYPPVIVPGGPPHHSTTLMHQPHLQMDLRTSQTRRSDSSGNSTSRSQTGSQVNKTGGSKPYYGNWTQN